MLTSVTFLAILSLQGSTTQIRIVSNLQIKEDVFHTSKRELGSQYDAYKDQMDKIQELSLAMEGAVKKNSDGVSAPESISIDPILDTVTGAYTQLSQLRYTKKIPVNLNYSFAKDSSVGAISSMPFEIVSLTKDNSERFSSSQRLGFKYNVPSAGR
jgi:hypothetical protein